YLADPASWVQKADEAELNLIMLASPYVSEDLIELANNRLDVSDQGGMTLLGGLTMDLPVRLPLLEAELPAVSIQRANVSPGPRPSETAGAATSGSVRTQASQAMQDMQIIDLQAPRPERRPPLPGPISADMPLTEVELEPEPQPLSPDELMDLMSDFQAATE